MTIGPEEYPFAIALFAKPTAAQIDKAWDEARKQVASGESRPVVWVSDGLGGEFQLTFQDDKDRYQSDLNGVLDDEDKAWLADAGSSYANEEGEADDTDFSGPRRRAAATDYNWIGKTQTKTVCHLAAAWHVAPGGWARQLNEIDHPAWCPNLWMLSQYAMGVVPKTAYLDRARDPEQG